MNEQIIKCPKCKNEFPLTETLASQIKESLQDELNAESVRLNEQLEEKEQELKNRENDLTQRSKEIESVVEKKVTSEISRIKKEQQDEARKKVQLEVQELRNSLSEKEDALEEAQRNELKLRKDRQKLEADKKALNLKMQRELDSERDKIRKEAVESIAEEHDLREGDLQNTIDSLTTKIKDLEQSAHKGSQQAQGEVLELMLEDFLKENFPNDNIKPVLKGMKGADVLQEVKDEMGKVCGTIIWESKRTKAWKNEWIEKLKGDQRKAGAEIPVILTKTLPNEIDNFAQKDGVWVTNYKSILGLSSVLRTSLIEISKVKVASVGKNQKTEMLYNYLVGQEFKNRIEALVESFQAQHTELNKEKTAITKIWAKREKQISVAFESIVGIYGDMQGIIGLSMPEIEQLELESSTPKKKRKLLE